MKRERFVIFLVLGLFASPLAGLAAAAPGVSTGTASEVRLPVTPPTQTQQEQAAATRQVRLDLKTVIAYVRELQRANGIE